MSVLHVNSANFEAEVIRSPKPVLLDFFAVWCGPCKMISPFIEQIAEENDQIKVCKIDVDEAPELASRFGVFSIPTLVVMDHGQILAQEVGARSKSQILAMLP